MKKLMMVVLLGMATQAAQAEEVTVSAAASLKEAFTDVAAVFQKKYPQDHVRLNFAASGALLQQMDKGAPVDVFASADEATMQKAVAKGLVKSGASSDFARNALVLITPAGAATPMRRLSDLNQARRIAVGNPASVPVGAYSQQALTSAGVWGSLKPKMVYGQSVRQVLDYVARGEVDSGLVYATDAAIMPGKVTVRMTVPTSTPILYPIAVTAHGEHSAAARHFVETVRSAQGQAILRRYGFQRP